jgi:rieske iron-sulfur protein
MSDVREGPTLRSDLRLRPSRRGLLRAGILLGLGCGFGSRGGFAQNDRALARPEAGDLLVGFDDATRTPLTPRDIPQAAAPMMAWAMEPASRTVRSGSRLNQILLLHLNPETLTADTRSRAADGVVAYTSICTHSGCDVDGWQATEQLLSCPCHDSIFDPRDGGRVVDGPAPRVLPALPLRIADGKLVVARPFTAPIGFEKG